MRQLVFEPLDPECNGRITVICQRHFATISSPMRTWALTLNLLYSTYLRLKNSSFEEKVVQRR